MRRKRNRKKRMFRKRKVNKYEEADKEKDNYFDGTGKEIYVERQR